MTEASVDRLKSAILVSTKDLIIPLSIITIKGEFILSNELIIGLNWLKFENQGLKAQFF